LLLKIELQSDPYIPLETRYDAFLLSLSPNGIKQNSRSTIKRSGMKMKKNSSQTNLPNRREFLQVAAAAATITMVKAGSVRGSQANSRIKAGLIGLGGRGTMIGNMILEHGGYELATVADYFPEVAETVGEQLKVDAKRRFHGLDGYRKLIGSGVEAVFCETPPYCFPDHVTAAVNAGCHVYMAKPIACDVPGTITIRKMAEKAASLGKVFLIDFQMRTDPVIIESVKRVQDGGIGVIGMLNTTCGSNGFDDPPKTGSIASRLRNLTWVNDTNLGGGYLVNYDIHAMDVALWIAGANPLCAMGSALPILKNPAGDSRRVYSVTLEFEQNFIWNHQSEHFANLWDKLNCNAFGSAGYAETNYWGKTWVHSNINPYRGAEINELYTEGAKRNIDTFHKSIIKGDYSNPTVKPGLDANFTSILAREAAERRTTMTMEELIRENKALPVDYSGLVL
jgi:myo-inositol 2-dehydrogenase / D-chiro-inositol 1-dehydrogenase